MANSIKQFLYQNGLKVTEDSATYSYFVECPFCQGKLKINYCTGFVFCSACDCRGIHNFNNIKKHIGKDHPKEVTRMLVRKQLVNLNIMWVLRDDHYITKCPRCHVGDDLTLKISPKLNLTHCTNCGYRNAFTAMIPHLDSEGTQKKVEGYINPEKLMEVAKSNLERYSAKPPPMFIPNETQRRFFERSGRMAIHEYAGKLRSERIVKYMSNKLYTNESSCPICESGHKPTFAHGGLIKSRPKGDGDYKLMQMDFSGAEIRTAAYMAKVGADASDSLRKLGKALFKAINGVNFNKYLKGEWIMLDSLTGVDQKISIACADAFNPNEMADMVSREHPFMYTTGAKPIKSKSDDHKYHNDCVYVFVHQSLIRKASVCGFDMSCVIPINCRQFQQASCGNYYVKVAGVDNNVVGRLKKLFKKIYSAKWPDQRKIDVQVKYEKL